MDYFSVESDLLSVLVERLDIVSSRVDNLFDMVVELSDRVAQLEAGTPPAPPKPKSGIWISTEELMERPIDTPEWAAVLQDANRPRPAPDLGDNDSPTDVLTYAAALVAERIDDFNLSWNVIDQFPSVMQSRITRALELSRGLQSYIITADLLGYRNLAFQQWLENVVNANIQGHGGTGLIGTAMYSATNWGNHARAALLAAGLYLQREDWINIVVQAHKEMVGEPVETKRLKFTDTTWHADLNDPMGINPVGAMRDGVHISGVLPEDWRRGSFSFVWPPATSTYMWEGVQGLIVTAVMLDRAGLVPITAGDNAVRRVIDMLYGKGEASLNSPVLVHPAAGDDLWILPLVNMYCGTNFDVQIGAPGKGMGYTYWTHGG